MTFVKRSLLLAAGLAAVAVLANVALTLKWPAVVTAPLGIDAAATAAVEDPPAAWKLEPIEGTKDIERVILSPKAVERLDVKTVAVREEKRAVRGRLIAADMLTPPATAAQAGLVAQVLLASGEDPKSLGQPAMVFASPVRTAAATGTAAKPTDAPAWVKNPAGGAVAYLQLDAATKDLKPGQHVWIEFGSQAQATRKIVPFSSVLYDADGKTWAYVNTKPQTYERAPVTIETIEGDDVVLTDGPPTGAAVVTDGAVEIYGTESKVGH